MMRRMRMMGLCLVAVFAITATAAATASAAPEYFVKSSACTKKFGPIWSGGECTVTHKILAATKITYTVEDKEASTLEGGNKITCENSKGKGDLEGSKKTVKLKLEYFGCKSPELAASCQTSAKVLGKITTESIKGELTKASENKEEPLATTVVNRLTPEKELFAKFECAGKFLKVKVKGGIFIHGSNVHPVAEEGQLNVAGHTDNLKKEKADQNGKAEECGHQQYLFENGGEECLHTFTNASVSWNISEANLVYKTAITTQE